MQRIKQSFFILIAFFAFELSFAQIITITSCDEFASIETGQIFVEGSSTGSDEVLVCAGESVSFCSLITPSPTTVTAINLSTGETQQLEFFPENLTVSWQILEEPLFFEEQQEFGVLDNNITSLYTVTFATPGTYTIVLDARIRPPEESTISFVCPPTNLDENGFLTATQKTLTVIVGEISQIQGFDENGQGVSQNAVLEPGEETVVNLKAILDPDLIQADLVRWSIEPLEAGALEQRIGPAFDNTDYQFTQSSSFGGGLITIRAKCGDFDTGKTFTLIVSDFFIESDKRYVCFGEPNNVVLNAGQTSGSTSDLEDVVWSVNRGGTLLNVLGSSTVFIYDGSYISDNFRDIVVSANLDGKTRTITLTAIKPSFEIKGIRKNENSKQNGVNATDNDFGRNLEEVDPTKDSRIFVDTNENWDGKRLNFDSNQIDNQSLIVQVKIIPEDIPLPFLLSDFKVSFEVTDPDDPASHKHIDFIPGAQNITPRANPLEPLFIEPDSFEKTGLDSITTHQKDVLNLGKDNTGKEHEGAEFWFLSETSISGTSFNFVMGTPITENTLIGQMQAKFTKKFVDGLLTNVSQARFFFSDHGGDNFKIKVSLFDTTVSFSSALMICDFESGTLTVWRKRYVEIMAMTNTEGGTYIDDSYEHSNFYPWDKKNSDATNLFGLKKLRDAVQKVWAHNDPNRNCYVDFVLTHLSEQTTPEGFNSLDLPVRENFNNFVEDLEDYITNYINSDTPLLDETIKVIGVPIISTVTGDLGLSHASNPYTIVSGIAHLENFNNKMHKGFEVTVAHELYHKLANEVSYRRIGASDSELLGSYVAGKNLFFLADDFHKLHTNIFKHPSFPLTKQKCAGNENENILKICPRHVFFARKNITRRWRYSPPFIPVKPEPD